MPSLETILAVLGGGLGVKVVDYIVAKNKNKLDSFESIVKTWEQDNIRLREREVELVNKIEALQKDLDDLRVKVMLLESAHMSLPIPMWLKDTDSKMLALNKAYENLLLKPAGFTAVDYLGHFDSDIWGDTTSKQFRDNDLKVLASKKPEILTESWIINGEQHSWTVIKYPRFYDGKIIGIGGIAIPPKNLKL